MKRVAVVLGIWFGLVGAVAYADDTEPFFGTERAASVLNAPAVAWTTGKAVAGQVQPGIEQLYDLNGEWRTGTSVALWTWTNQEIPLVQVRSGYAVDYLPYVSAPIDLKGVTTRYLLPILPDKAEGWLTAGPLDVVWSAIGKYGIVGPWIGWNFDEAEDGNNDDGGLVGGVSVGAKFTF